MTEYTFSLWCLMPVSCIGLKIDRCGAYTENRWSGPEPKSRAVGRCNKTNMDIVGLDTIPKVGVHANWPPIDRSQQS
jgi:hypothetical protein